ncbi:hypothetical protein Tco_1173616 [Tanacetum coccineum]
MEVQSKSEMGDIVERAATTAASLDAMQDSDEEDLVVNDPSKQGRSLIEEMDLDARISLVPLHVEVQGRYEQNLETKEGFGDGHEVSTVAQVSTTSTFVSKRPRMAQVHQAAQGFTDAEWDDVLARVTACEDFVQQLQAGEKCSEEDLPMKLVELVNQRKKFSCVIQRAEAKREQADELLLNKEDYYVKVH